MLSRNAAALIVAVVLGAVSSAAEADEQVAKAFDSITTAVEDGDFGGARSLVDLLLARPDLPDADIAAALGQLATIETEADRPEAAIAALGSALQFDPNNFWLRMRSCNANLDFGFLAAARQDCKLAAQALRHERDPGMAQLMRQFLDFTEARNALAFGDVKRGLALVRRLKDEESLYFAPWYVYYLTGRLLSQDGDTVAALEQFRQGLEAHKSEKETPKAGTDIDRAVLHFYIGLQLERLDRSDEARTEYNTAFALLPETEVSASLPAQVETIAYAACSLNLLLENGAIAVDQCGWLSERAPDRIAYLDALALAYKLMGDADMAGAVRERALLVDADNRQILDRSE